MPTRRSIPGTTRLGSTAFAFSVGLADHDLRRLVRRRELVHLHQGIYLEHTGAPTWLQQAWGGVLACWPAALDRESALRAVEGPGSRRPTSPIQVAVPAARHVSPPPGVVVHRTDRFQERVQWNTGPPRIRLEEATVDVAAEARTEFDTIGVLASAVQGRRTTAQRLQTAVEGRVRVPRRRFLVGVLSDVAAGTCSVLEHGYLTKVERPHRLPRAHRQLRDRLAAGAVYRDVEYDVGLVVELDGRLLHNTVGQRDKDFDRDLDTAATGRTSVRVPWGQVFDRPCWTAGRLGLLLQRAGWEGRAQACGPTCTLARAA